MDEYVPKFNSLVARLARDITDVIGTLYEVAGHKDVKSEQKEKCLDLITEFKTHSDTVHSLFDLKESKKDKDDDKKDDKETEKQDDEDAESKAFAEGLRVKD